MFKALSKKKVSFYHNYSLITLNNFNTQSKLNKLLIYQNLADPHMELKEELGLVVIDLLTILLSGNNANVTIFRENHASKCSLQLVTLSSSLRGPTLGNSIF